MNRRLLTMMIPTGPVLAMLTPRAGEVLLIILIILIVLAIIINALVEFFS